MKIIYQCPLKTLNMISFCFLGGLFSLYIDLLNSNNYLLTSLQRRLVLLSSCFVALTTNPISKVLTLLQALNLFLLRVPNIPRPTILKHLVVLQHHPLLVTEDSLKTMAGEMRYCISVWGHCVQ